MKNLKRMITPRNVSVLVAFLFSLAFGILKVFGILPQYVDAVILLTLSALIFWMLSEKVSVMDALDEQHGELHQSISKISNGVTNIASNLTRPNGIFAVYPSRDILPPYAGFVETARDQIIIISIDLQDTSARYLDNLVELAIRGCKIRLLAFNPESAALVGVAKLLGQREDYLRGRIKAHLEHIQDYCFSRLPKEKAENIQIRTYDWTPTWVGMAVDPSSPKGKLLVGVCQHGTAKGNWPEFELRSIGDSTLYDFYSARFVHAWNDAAS